MTTTGYQIVANIARLIDAEGWNGSTERRRVKLRSPTYQGLSGACKVSLESLADFVIKTGGDLERVGTHLTKIGLGVQKAGEGIQGLDKRLSQ